MFNIGKRISELRKEKNWSQSDLAKAVESTRDIIGKYERGEHSPSIEMATKIAEALEVSVDYLLGKERFGKYDKESIKRLEGIQKMDADTRGKLFDIIILILGMLRQDRLMQDKERQIRAIFDEQTITVYQAYRKEIALLAVEHQKFVSPFKIERMTWIKPSFLWMMYRCGWATKEGQEHVLAIKIKRDGFQWALDNSCLSHFDADIHNSKEEWENNVKTSPVRIQWDPERDIHLEKLPYRSIQIGLSGIAVDKYINEWIVSIEDITPLCKHIHSLISINIEEAQSLLPKEKNYNNNC